MRLIAAGLVVAAFGLGAAFAQQSEVEADPALDALFADDEEPEDELDALSRTPDDPFPTLEETKKREPVSVTLRALDKITARFTDIEAPIGEPVEFGSLEILPRFCDKRPPEEFPETTAFLEISDRDLGRATAAYKDPALAERAARAREEARARTSSLEPTTEVYSVEASVARNRFGEAPASETGGEESYRAANEETPRSADPNRIFTGWMFASSPALNSLEHPVYDVWVIDCKTVVVDR